MVTLITYIFNIYEQKKELLYSFNIVRGGGGGGMSCIICRVGGRSGMILHVGLLILAGLQGGLRPLTCDLVGPPSVGLEDHACNQVKARDSHVDGVQICP